MNITYINHLGSDLTVVNAARVSFDAQSTELTDRDRRLIQYLADHGHWTPFAHAVLQYRVEAPIFVARQWFRHTVGIARNEVSRRYVDYSPEFWAPEQWRTRPGGSIKQGSGEAADDDTAGPVDRLYRMCVESAAAIYGDIIAGGIAPEQARAVLPQGTYTAWIETASLYAVARIYRQRADDHAQIEAQQLAGQLGAVAAERYPVSWSALTG